LNLAPEAELTRLLGACCGSTRWVQAFAACRPWASLDELLRAAERAASGLGESDWLDAFRAHPRIGEKPAEARDAATRWAAGEQSRVDDAAAGVRAELAEANRAYEAKFGHIYIVCATGKTADEMLAICKERLANDAATERLRAAVEQKKITRLRLEKLVRQ
jgi:OHCU decarboxylase